MTDISDSNNQAKTSEADPAAHTFLPDFCNARIIFLAILIAQLLSFVLTLAGGISRPNFWVYLSLVSLFVTFIAIGNILVLCVSRKFLHTLHPAAAAVTYYALSLSITLIVSVVSILVTPTEALWAASPENVQTLNLLDILTSDILIRNMAISAIVSAVALRYFYVQHQWRANIQVEAKSRIQALQARIRPHFLFNSMNTIASLTLTNPQMAEKAVEDLADLFRASLGHQDKVSLQEELNFTRRYINMEKLRLGDRLTIELKIEEGISLNTKVPALILQPIVENAIYHGVEPLTKGGTVNIDITSTQHDLHLTISNPVGDIHIDRKRPGNKMAQENIRQRLQLAYGDFSSMDIRQDQGFYEVSFNIPIEADL
ncbi:MAG: sensor histidine kinase [Gammaproteobacteria bacterium]